MRATNRARHGVALTVGLLTIAVARPSSLLAQHEHSVRSPFAATSSDSSERSLATKSAESKTAVAKSAMVTPMGSGTAWVPSSSEVRGAHVMAGEWMLMLHGVAYGEYTHQDGPRGGWQVGSINWLMLSAAHPAAGGRVEIRAMGSAEPFTLGGVGYPLLLQTGETYMGVPLHDRQHPHDLAMEISTTFERQLAGPLSASLYVAPVGEPAAGPVAFMHRPSSVGDPFAPLSHHWQDGDHVTFGVVTAGLFSRHAKLEGSLFNGREPDEIRTNFDYKGRRLDSWSARATLLPASNWALSGWYAYLESPEAMFPDDWNKHLGASMLHSRAIGSDGTWSSAIIWGAKRHEQSLRHPVTRLTHSLTAESSLEIGRRNTLFARAEYVQKDMEELFLPHAYEQVHEVRAVSAGYVLDIARAGSAALGLGVRGAMDFVPPGLTVFYGGPRPLGAAVFARLGFERSNAKNSASADPMDGMQGMEHMDHAGH